MTASRICMLAFLLGLGTAGLAACDSTDGPAEQAGEKIDNATQKAGQAVENMGDNIQKQAE